MRNNLSQKHGMICHKKAKQIATKKRSKMPQKQEMIWLID